jgi:YidC/Oxa1 family membrane protein insertase
MSALLGVPVDAAYHLVFALTRVLTPLLGGLAAVAGIVVFTVAVRLLVSPLTFRALRGQAAQARLAPQIQRLRERYGSQPERLQGELTALYQREGTSVFAGFGPLLAQWPVFSVLYLLFRSPTIAGVPNQLLSRGFIGVPLGSHWLSGSGAFSVHGAVFLAVLAVLALACWLAARVARRMSAAVASGGDAGGTGTGGTQPGAAAPSQPANGRVLAALGKVLPYLTVVIAAFAPLAGAIYLVTSTGWSAAERLVFAARSGGRATATTGAATPVHAGPAADAGPVPSVALAKTAAASRNGEAGTGRSAPVGVSRSAAASSRRRRDRRARSVRKGRSRRQG